MNGRNRMSGRLAFFLALACAALMLPLHAQQRSAQAGQVDAQAIAAERVWRNYQQRIAVAIGGGGQPRDLALAAVLQDVATADPEQPSADADAQAWRWAAAESAGQDVLANAMLMMGGGDGAGALHEQAARRWAQAEPDNIAALLFQRDGVDALLANARGFTRFDLHMYDQVRWIQSKLVQHPPTANERAVLFGDDAVPIEEHAAISAMGLWAAVAIPSLQELAEACEG